MYNEGDIFYIKNLEKISLHHNLKIGEKVICYMKPLNDHPYAIFKSVDGSKHVEYATDSNLDYYYKDYLETKIERRKRIIKEICQKI